MSSPTPDLTPIPDILLRTIYLSLATTLKENPIAFYELVQLARNPEHQLFGNTGQYLMKTGLMDSATRIQTTCVEVILAAVAGEELDMHLRPFSELLAES